MKAQIDPGAEVHVNPGAAHLLSKPKKSGSGPKMKGELKRCVPTPQQRTLEEMTSRGGLPGEFQSLPCFLLLFFLVSFPGNSRPKLAVLETVDFLPVSRIWSPPSRDGDGCQPSAAGVGRSPLAGFGICVLFNLKCCDLCCNLFPLSRSSFALLTDPSAGFRISAGALETYRILFFFFFFRKITWC